MRKKHSSVHLILGLHFGLETNVKFPCSRSVIPDWVELCFLRQLQHKNAKVQQSYVSSGQNLQRPLSG